MSSFPAVKNLFNLLKLDNGIEVVIRRLFFRKTGMVTCRWKGLEFIVDYRGRDECGIFPCIFDGMYQHYVELMDLGPAPRILDLGANAGGFILMLGGYQRSLAKVVAVEMNPATLTRLQLNMIRNFLPAPILLNAAVVGAKRTLEIPQTLGGTARSIYDQADGTTQLIEGITLDETIERHFGSQDIDLCKMDVERAEYEVFQGQAWGRIRQCRHLLIEIHRAEGQSQDGLKKFIEAQGFTHVRWESGERKDVFCFRRNDVPAAKTAGGRA